MAVSIGDRAVGDGNPCFITFEAGPTHSGLKSAKRLTRLAAEAGADAIKFQMLDADRLVADKEKPFSYGILADRESGRVETKTESLYEILKRRELEPAEWRELAEYAHDLGIAFFCTACFEDEIDLLCEIGCQSIKIASADINHLPLIRHAARTGLCIQLDTGSSTIGEVERAVDAILAEGNEQIIIHHCPSGYPARLESINLRVIPTLKRMFEDIPIAFSDHTPGWEIDIAALALGANLLEKTITEDRMTPLVEHVMSLEPDEMQTFVRTIREVETGLGHARRLMSEKERESGKAVRRSAYARQDIAPGSTITEADIEYRRPGDGIPPDLHDMLLAATPKRRIKAGEKLHWSLLHIENGRK